MKILKTPEELKVNLNKININNLKNNIKKMESIDLKKASDEEILNNILNVLLTEDLNIIIPTRFIPYKKNEKFYRIRPIERIDKINNISDAWEAPPEYVKSGRLHVAKESLLYTSQNHAVAIIEMKSSLQPEKEYCLIEYTAVDDFEVLEINSSIDYYKNELTEEQYDKLSLILDFLKQQFGKKVEQGEEHLYRVSNLIVKEFYSLEKIKAPLVGWKFVSIETEVNTGYENDNICFVPEKVKNKKIDVSGIRIAKYSVDKDINHHKITQVIGSFEIKQDGSLIYLNEEDMRKKIIEKFQDRSIFKDTGKIEKELIFYSDPIKYCFYSNLIFALLNIIKDKGAPYEKNRSNLINFSEKCLNLDVGGTTETKERHKKIYLTLIEVSNKKNEDDWIDDFLNDLQNYNNNL